MTQNDPKWPKNDAQIYALFPQFFLTEKAVPQTFSLLECVIELMRCPQTGQLKTDQHQKCAIINYIS